MTKERFDEILSEYNYPDNLIEEIWENAVKNREDVDEDDIRKTCEKIQKQIGNIGAALTDSKILTKEEFLTETKEFDIPDELAKMYWEATDGHGGITKTKLRVILLKMANDKRLSALMELRKMLTDLKDVIEKPEKRSDIIPNNLN